VAGRVIDRGAEELVAFGVGFDDPVDVIAFLEGGGGTTCFVENYNMAILSNNVPIW